MPLWFQRMPMVFFSVGILLYMGCETKLEPTGSEADGVDNTDGTDSFTGAELPVTLKDNGLEIEVGFPDSISRTLVVTQGDTSVEFSVMDGTTAVLLTPADFSAFVSGGVVWSLMSQGSALSQGEAYLTERFTNFFEMVIPPGDKLDLAGLPQFAALDQEVSVSATLQAKAARGTVFVGTPAGRGEEIIVGDGVVPAGESLSFSVQFKETGLYVVEVLSVAGTPLANVPVYAGGTWPVFISRLDSLPGVQISDSMPLEDFRSKMLSLINDRRVAAALPELVGDDALDAVSQTKAELMCDEQYLSHTSKEGFGAGERLATAGLSGPYRENIAAERGPERVFWTWWWSPSHRAPYMESRWRRAGLGASLFQTGLAAFAQHFME